MISREQWSGIENTLKNGFFEVVKFKMPSGEEITVQKSPVSENKMALIVWIDGKRSTAWGWPDHDEFRTLTRQIWRRRTFKPGAPIIRRLSKTKQGQRILKSKEHADLHKVFEYWDCCFNTASSLVRQFRKIDGLELVEPVAGGGRDDEPR